MLVWARSVGCLRRADGSSVASVPAQCVRSCKKAAERGGRKRHCISLNLFDSFQILLGKVQKVNSQDVPCPELAFFVSVQRMDLEGPACRPKYWDVSDSSR